MTARCVLACIPLITLMAASQPVLAENGNDPPAASPSANPAPAKQPRKHHSGRPRHHQKPAAQPSTTTTPSGN